MTATIIKGWKRYGQAYRLVEIEEIGPLRRVDRPRQNEHRYVVEMLTLDAMGADAWQEHPGRTEVHLRALANALIFALVPDRSDELTGEQPCDS